jgi:predicted Zn-dependent protease
MRRLKYLGGTMLRKFLPVILVLALLPGCAARDPGDPLKPGFNLFSKEQDIQLGREAAAQVRQQVQVVSNRELQNYITQIGQRLARQQGADEYPYSFTLVNDPSVNAFALPGGPTFVHTGLVKAAENEAQLAGVIAHEIAHVALRHGTNQASKANLIQLPAMIAGGLAGNGILGQLAQLGIGLGANSVLLKYSRDAV